MTNEKLESKLAELLNVSSHEESITFLLFKKRVAESLKIGEALKVNDLGVFQLKEQLKKVEKSKAKSSTAGKTVLIFSSESDGTEKESLFLTLEIEPSKKDSTEFDESVFSIGIGKPTVPIGVKDTKGSDTESELSIDEKISNLISSSEKLEKYDLWDDYLDGKQSFAGLLDEVEEEEITDLEDYLNHDDTTPNPNDFVELDEEELLAEFDDSEIIVDEELEVNEFTEEVMPNEEEAEVEIEPEETSKETIDIPEKVIEEKIEEILEDAPIETEELISDVENVVEDVQDEVIAETEIKLHEEVLEPIAEKVSEVEIEEKKTDSKIEEPKEEQALLFSSDPEFYNKNKEDDEMAHPGMNSFKKGYSPTIIALIIAFFIVGSIGIYYLFFDNPTWLYDQNEVEITLSEKHAREFEEAKKRVMAVNTTSNSDDNDLGTNNETIDENEDVPIIKNENKAKKNTKKNSFAQEIEKDIEQNNKISNTIKKNSQKTTTQKSNTKKTSTVPKVTTSKPKVTNEKSKVVKDRATETPKVTSKSKTSREVNNNIFFDGTNYSVQISSWKQQRVAEQEVTRLKKKGYSAYVIKAYIPKFKANWHRVRIGNIATLKEAQSIQKNVK